MKKLTALFMGCMMITASLASCGDSDDGDSKSSKKKSDPLAGSWKMEDEESGMELVMVFDDGKMDMEMDLSPALKFEGEDFVLSGENVGSDYVSFEDDNLVVDLQGMEVVNMKCEEKTGDNYDGTYTDLGGMMFDSLGEEMGEEMMDYAKVRIEDGSFILQFNDVCDYEIEDDDTVMLKNPPATLVGEDGKTESEMTYKVDGDKLDLTSEDGETETLTKVK